MAYHGIVNVGMFARRTIRKHERISSTWRRYGRPASAAQYALCFTFALWRCRDAAGAESLPRIFTFAIAIFRYALRVVPVAARGRLRFHRAPPHVWLQRGAGRRGQLGAARAV